MGRNLNSLERRGLVRIRLATSTSASTSSISRPRGGRDRGGTAVLAQGSKRIAALVQFSAIGELADQLDAGGRVSRFSREKSSTIKKCQ